MNNNKDIELPLLPNPSSKKTSKGTFLKQSLYANSAKIESGHRSHFIEYLDDSPNTSRYKPRASFFRWVTFLDVLPFVKGINQNQESFSFENIPNPEYKFNIETKILELDYYWANETKKQSPRLSSALYKTFDKEIMQSLILTFVENISKILYSIYMGQIVKNITSNESGEAIRSENLIFSAVLLSIFVIISIFAKTWSFFVISVNLAKARLTLSGFMYKKLNSTSLSSLHEIKLGKVINLLGNDLNDLRGLFFVPTLLITPLMVLIGTYVMWGYFGPSCLVGLCSLVVVLYSQVIISNRNGKFHRDNKKIADERIKFTHEVIEGIRLIKMYTWDQLFGQKINDLRQIEQNNFLKIARIDAISMNLSGLCGFINILLICIVYTSFDGVLSPEKVYASLMILMFLSSSLLYSHQARVGLVNVHMVIDRTQEVLSIQDILLVEETSISHKFHIQKMSPVIFTDFTCYWSKTALNPCLSNINLACIPGTLTAIIGKIGCGKTSLLLSFLREMPLSSGKLDYSGKIAYVEQDPVIFSGTIRENILFGKEYEEILYKQVLESCQLYKDLETLPYGDLTLIGERGINLSGGQKARVSLARAFYSQSNIFLLDDPFSALDSRIAREIFDKMLRGNALQDKIMILVTHHLHFAKEADHVVLMNEGKIEAQGAFKDLEALNIKLLSVFKVDEQDKIEEAPQITNQKLSQNPEQVVSKVQEKDQSEESIKVSWRTYKDYLKIASSEHSLWVIVLLFLMSNGIMIYYTGFMGYWAEQQVHFMNDPERSLTNTFDHGYYFIMCTVFLLVLSIISYVKTVKAHNFFYTTNTKIHQGMLQAILRARTIFFDINPIGRILNRFSNDLGLLDKVHPKTCFECFENGTSYICVLITVCIISPFILIPTVLLMYGLYRTRLFFDKPMILVKELELASKSPMISSIPATIQGLIIIRIYNQGGRFLRQFMDMIFDNIKALVFLEKTTRLFGFMLEASIQFLTLSGIWIFIILMYYYNIRSGLLGLCLMYLLKIGDQGSIIIRQSLYADINMQSAQRMLDYCQIKSEAPAFVPEEDNIVIEKFNGNWPVKGEIEFNQVYLKYRDNLGFALSGLTFKVSGGLKVGCIGRTGAGKSSIIQALFRMVEIENGPNFQESYIKIDDTNVRSIGLNLLRSKIAIIPQNPVIFADSIRRNLDPFAKLADKEIWDILKEVGLKAYVKSLPNQLDTDITISASIFSSGQKQLMCLARAIITKSKVIVLDEATANVDVETDSFIQKAIMERFKECTVLTIAHRLITIANYDKVIVIDNGRATEYDAPYLLLVKKIGDNQITRSNGMFSEMVQSTGRSMAKKIFDVARNHYFQKHY